jgi:hypothetical protein
MKKIFVVYFFLLISIVAYSQNRFGVLAGINGTSISKGFLKTGGDLGYAFHIGALCEIELIDKIVFRPKILYSEQGDNVVKLNKFYVPSHYLDYKLSYLNIPLDIKFFKKPYIIVGPQFGYLVSTKKLNLDFGEVKNKIDFGVNLGMGYDIKNVFVELNIYQGDTEIIIINDSKLTNTVIQFSVGYFF